MSKLFARIPPITALLSVACFILFVPGVQAQSYCSSTTQNSPTTITAVECSTPIWTYQFTYPISADGDKWKCAREKIQHCGRSQNGQLEYELKAPTTGEVVIFYNAPVRGTAKLTVGSHTYTQPTNATGTWHTGVTVTAEQALNFFVDTGDSPYLGWTSPHDGACRGFANGPSALDITGLNQAATNAKATIIAKQCWGDGYAYEAGGPNSKRVSLTENKTGNTVNVACQGSAQDCHDVLIEDMDFNDGAYWVAVVPNAAPTLTSTPSPTPTSAPQRSSCDSLSVVSGNNSLVPAKVTLRGAGSDSNGSIQSYRFFFGDGQNQETTSTDIQHEYKSSGRFSARLEVKDSLGNWKTSSNCETTVTVDSSSIETHKSDCSDVYWTQNNNNQAPSNVEFHISGYDNKGSIQAYKLDFGTGVVKENAGQTFEQLYTAAGTYTIKAYIKDSVGDWKGGDDSCNRTLYVSTRPITQQPKTGTSTTFTLLGLGAGLTGALVAWWRQAYTKNDYSKTKHTSKSRQKIKH